MSGSAIDPDLRLREAFGSLPEDPEPASACPDAAEIWRAVTGDLTASRARRLVGHSAGCAGCAGRWRLARAVASEAGLLPAAKASRAGAPGAVGWAAAAAALLVIVAAAVVLIPRGAGPDPWSGISIPTVPYTPPGAGGSPVWRDSSDEASARAFAEAMRPYEAGDLQRAEARLAAFLRDHPRHAEAHFYRGVVLLSQGKPSDAAASLESAILLGGAPLRDEALWHLALARGKQGRQAEAIERLRAIAASSSPRRAEAQRLLERLGETGASGAP